MRALHRLGAGLLLALAASAAFAAVGLTQLPARGGDEPVAVFYPTADVPDVVERGPFRLHVSWQGRALQGNGRLVVLSHGSGGNAWPHSDLASRLVAAGFVVAVPLHRGDNSMDHGDAGPVSFKRRPEEVSHTIDLVAADPRLAPLLKLDKVGMFGMSAGGHTALVLAGGRWSPSRLLKHCEANLEQDFHSCVGVALRLKGDFLDGPKKAVVRMVLRQLLDDPAWYAHTDPRIAAVVAEVPFAVHFDPASLAQPKVPLGLVRTGKDIWLPPVHHIDMVLRSCTGCTLVADLPTAGHGSLLSPQLPPLPEPAQSLLKDPPGFDRALVPPAHAAIVAFMRQHLLP